jgi:hypothetical protein
MLLKLSMRVKHLHAPAPKTLKSGHWSIPAGAEAAAVAVANKTAAVAHAQIQIHSKPRITGRNTSSTAPHTKIERTQNTESALQLQVAELEAENAILRGAKSEQEHPDRFITEAFRNDMMCPKVGAAASWTPNGAACCIMDKVLGSMEVIYALRTCTGAVNLSASSIGV